MQAQGYILGTGKVVTSTWPLHNSSSHHILPVEEKDSSCHILFSCLPVTGFFMHFYNIAKVRNKLIRSTDAREQLQLTKRGIRVFNYAMISHAIQAIALLALTIIFAWGVPAFVGIAASGFFFGLAYGARTRFKESLKTIQAEVDRPRSSFLHYS